MPVNPLPVLIPLFIVWATVAYFLFRWRTRAGSSFLALTAIFMGIFVLYTDVKRHHVELMRFELEEVGDYSFVQLTTSSGSTISLSSPGLVARLRGRESNMVRVSWIGTYDFGRLRAYHFLTIDGINPDSFDDRKGEQIEKGT